MRTRSLVPVLAMTLGLAVISLAVPPPAVACSCMQSLQPMLEAKADPTLSVFTGTAGANEAQGVPVRLTRWFRGAIPPSRVAVLDPAGFVDPMGGMCGTNPPTRGTEWIFATARNAIGRYDVSLCTTHAPLDSDLGRELLAEAVVVFGPPAIPEPPPPAEPDPLADPGSIVPIALVLVGVLGLVIGLFGLAGRRRGET